ncbi:hypothetical protein QTP88_017869 [Uroleucon formosanum]
MIHFEDARAERCLTGVELSRIVEELCFKFDIDLAWCVGIGTDSCSVMASETKGAVHELSKKATNAKRCPCNNHILNNLLAKSSKVSACRNASATMRKVVAFANASAKRHKVFEEELEGMALQGICETRWVERHDGHLQFQGDNLVKICNALHRITTWEDGKTAIDAQCLRHVLCSSEFIIASVCLNDVLGTTVSLSRFLQTLSIDLKRATDAMKDTIFLLKQKRTNSDVVFQQLFSESKEIFEQLDVEIRLPRIVPRQKHRKNNQPGQTGEEYFRKSIYIPLLDSIIADLEERLSPEVLSLFNLGVFLPKTVYSEVDLVAVREAVKNYAELLHRPHISTVLSEFQLWVTKWKREVESGNKVPEFLPQDKILKKTEVLDGCNLEIEKHTKNETQVTEEILEIDFNNPSSWPPITDKIRTLLIIHGPEQGKNSDFYFSENITDKSRFTINRFTKILPNGEKVEHS